MEAPELAAGSIEVKNIAREPGSRTKIAIASVDPHVDPVGSLVGQRGVRVSTVMSELGGERIDIIEWSEDQKAFIKEALSPATVLDVVLNEEEHRAAVTVSEDQQSLAIGRGGQNVRLAAKLTGWNIDINATGVEKPVEEAVATATPDDAETPSTEADVSPSEMPAEVVADDSIAKAELTAEEETTPSAEGDVSLVDSKESRDKEDARTHSYRRCGRVCACGHYFYGIVWYFTCVSPSFWSFKTKSNGDDYCELTDGIYSLPSIRFSGNRWWYSCRKHCAKHYYLKRRIEFHGAYVYRIRR
jgi:transcription antitermination factor NusA-like protein